MNNTGVKPAGKIATVALQKRASIHKEEAPETMSQVVKDSYVNNLGLTASDQQELQDCVQEADKILGHARLKIKKWLYSPDNQASVEAEDLGAYCQWRRGRWIGCWASPGIPEPTASGSKFRSTYLY